MSAAASANANNNNQVMVEQSQIMDESNAPVRASMNHSLRLDQIGGDDFQADVPSSEEEDQDGEKP